MDGLGKATLLTALDLSGLNQGFDQAKADTKKFAQDASKELDNVKQSANEIANAKGLKELQTQIDDVRVRAKAAAQGVVIENGKIDASFNETGRQAGRMGQRVRDELDKSESRARRFAATVKTAIAAAVTVEAAKNIIGFLVDSAEKADEASESFSAQRVATENLTAAQDAFQIMIGQKVNPALATANTVYATMLELISGGIDLSTGLAANTEVMGSNFATAANDAQPLNTQLATIADRAANITIALAGVGQVSTGLVQVVGAPFAALGSFIGDTLAQVELATEAIKALGSFEFGIAKSNSQAIATIERDKLGNAASAAGASALEGFSNFQEGFTKIFSSEEIKANLSANILSGLQDASTKIEASQYASNLESSTSSATKTGVKDGLSAGLAESESTVANYFKGLANLQFDFGQGRISQDGLDESYLSLVSTTIDKLRTNLDSLSSDQLQLLNTLLGFESANAPVSIPVPSVSSAINPFFNPTQSARARRNIQQSLLGDDTTPASSLSIEAIADLIAKAIERSAPRLSNADASTAEQIRDAFGVGIFGSNSASGVSPELFNFFNNRNQANARAFAGNPFNPTPPALPAQNAFNLPANGALTGRQIPDSTQASGLVAEALSNFRPLPQTLGAVNTLDTILAESVRDTFGVGIFSNSGSISIPSRGAAVARSFAGNPFNPTPPVLPTPNPFNLPANGALTGSRITAPPSNAGQVAELLDRQANASKVAAEEAAEDAAEKQRQAAEDFASTVISSASQFGNAILSIADGNVGSGVSQIGSSIGGIIGLTNPILGAGISAGAGFLGGFIDLITRNDDEAEERRRAQQSRSVPAIQIVTNLEQNNNITYQGSSDPQVAANNNALAGQILTAIESNIIPRLERLELQVAS